MLKEKLILGSKERLKFKSMSSTKFQKILEILKLIYMSSEKFHKALRLK